MAFDPVKLRRQLVLHEGFARVPYVDTEGKVTGGIGHNFVAHPIPDDIIDRWYEEDVARAILGLDASLPWWRDLDEVRQRVMIDLAFNMGMGAPRKGGLLSFVNSLQWMKQGEYEQAAIGFESSRWFKQVKTRGVRIVRMIRTGEDL